MEPAAAGNYFDLIFFALLAAAIGYKLFTVLGRNDTAAPPPPPAEPPAEEEGKPFPEFQTNESWPPGMKAKKPAPAMKPREPEPVIADETVSKGLQAIKEKDMHFSAGAFLAGAKAAFELVLKALQEGDKTALKNLLSVEVYKDFAAEIERREKEGKFPYATLVAIRKAEITEAALAKFKATVSVEFSTEQILVVRDKEKKIIEGDPSAVAPLTDTWTFERDLRSGNPNWTIIAT